MNMKTNEILRSKGLEELKRLAREKKEKAAAQNAANSSSSRTVFPLTNAQKGMWALDQFLNDNKAYNNPFAIRCRLDHEFDPEKVRKTLDTLANKHNIFRTTIRLVDDEPSQCIDSNAGFDFAYDDISDWAEVEKDKWIMKVAREEGRKNFDLEKGPLVRWHMVKTNKGEFVIMLTFHHIISDGWTMSLCIKEFMSLYFDLGGNEKVPQFTDYALEESRWYEEGKFNQGLDYWVKKLESVHGVLELATDHPRPQTMSFEGGIVSLSLEAKAYQEIQSFAAKKGATTFHLMLAAYHLLLHKYSGQQDIVLGVPFANRMLSQTQEMMGLFMNTLPLRFHIDKDTTLEELVSAAKAESESAAEHQSIPLNRILEALHYKSDPSINPLYQAVLTYQVYPHSRNTHELFTFSPIKVDYGVSKLDLNLWVEEDGDGLVFTLNYNTDLFERHTIEKMLASFKSLLMELVERAHLPVKSLSLVTPEEREYLLEKCQPSEAQTFPPVFRLFEEQAIANPTEVAVRCEERSFTYSGLNAAANHLASELISLGLKAGQSVAILMDKSEHSVAALLAVMKAGGCYVPVDIALPESKVAYILDDASVSFALVAGGLPDSLSGLSSKQGIQWLDVANNDKAGSETSLVEFNSASLTPDSPAYIIYTSGSTGVSKGVCVSHAQLSQYCHAIIPVLDQPSGARYGMFSSFTTDLAHTMLFPSLIQMGELVVMSANMLENPTYLVEYLSSYPLDCMKITPTHLSALMALPDAGAILPRDVLVLGGERLPVSLIKRIQTVTPTCRIINHYGPTETTVGVSTFLLPNDLASDIESVPIGKPLDGCHVLILDENEALVPVGIPGEICIGGSQLSNGYVGLPEQTNQRFIEHPFVAGERLYRTGDKGRLLADGNLAYLGRLDRQCKIRGYRVELAEVEQALMSLSGVHQAAVKHQEYRDGTSTLIAYLVCENNPAENLAQQDVLKQSLKELLPHYMLPESWIWLDAMPLMANGKVNYHALPNTDKRHDEQRTVSQPETDVQSRLLGLYQNALNIDKIDIHDGFLDLGGNSISAIKLIIEVNKAFNTALNLGQMFENSSIVELSALIEQMTNSESGNQFGSSLVRLNEGLVDSKPTLVLVHPAGGNVFCYHELVQELGSDYPVYGVQVADFRNNPEYNHDITALAAHYLEEVQSIISSNSRLVVGGWSLGGTIAFEMAYQINQAYGIEPSVVVFDQPAPQVNVDNSASMSEHERLAYFAHKVELFTGISFNTSSSALAALPDEQRTEVFLDGFRQADLVPDNISVDDFKYFLGILWAHMTATDRYMGRRFSGSVIVAEANDILQGRTQLDEPGLGWQAYSEQEVTIIPAQGDHLSMMNLPNIRSLAEKLKSVLL
ncbi:Linear gramicidin synthase subunit D [Marinomonas spartinae]|uniref:non-ribosomal peptide synthetase n=1 Tax=Marinomonas spartinae TaxID=1792290 RepID=UPI000808E473|nr:non-ribosomal peptide synthetase [Marinomonas spartinae]SBS34236.1 Linear gramicidin synthase subunit D [Marinomonas spartinae]